MYTRKQLWRRCNTKIFNLNVDKNYFIDKKIKKKVRFSDTVYLTLIPTRKELDFLKNMYIVKLDKNIDFNNQPKFLKN